MITLKIEDLTIKQIIKICKEQTCAYCPIKNYCNANFAGQPKFFDADEDTVDVEFYEG